jgi:hypothetical protein
MPMSGVLRWRLCAKFSRKLTPAKLRELAGYLEVGARGAGTRAAVRRYRDAAQIQSYPTLEGGSDQ